MINFIPNEKKDAIQFVFTDFFTKERQFTTTFDLNTSKEIGEDLIKLVNEIEKKKIKERNNG